MFRLHSNLINKLFVADLPLSRVLLEDDCLYPWVFLVPRREQVARIMDLSFEDQVQLLRELDLIQRVFWQLYQPTQINVAAIGNKTPQLHVHVIARHEGDPAWPGTVWDHPRHEPYSSEEKIRVVGELQQALKKDHQLDALAK